MISILMATIVGLILGWLLRGEECESQVKRLEKEIEALKKSLSQEPELLSTPRGGQKDDLTQLKGIGSVLEERLNGLGIYHLDQIASWNSNHVKWVDQHMPFPGRIEREAWVDQAKKLLD